VGVKHCPHAQRESKERMSVAIYGQGRNHSPNGKRMGWWVRMGRRVHICMHAEKKQACSTIALKELKEDAIGGKMKEGGDFWLPLCVGWTWCSIVPTKKGGILREPLSSLMHRGLIEEDGRPQAQLGSSAGPESSGTVGTSTAAKGERAAVPRRRGRQLLGEMGKSVDKRFHRSQKEHLLV
jgi:hypothetical protein